MRKITLFLVGLIMGLTALVGLASTAQAAPVSLKFDNGRLTIGEIFNNRVVLPASSTFPSDDLPLPQRTDIELFGNLDGDQITIPQALNSGLQFPYMNILHPFIQDLRIPITVRLNEDGLTGTWDEATGNMSLQGTVDFVVVTGTGTLFPLPDSLDDLGVPPLGLLARCRMNDVPVDFSTANSTPTTAQPFTEGFGKNGALTTSWTKLPAAESENGGECDELNALLNVSGGLWLSNAVVDPVPQPGPPPPSCATDQFLCPPPTFTEIDDVRLVPARKKVKQGGKVTIKVRVHNSGNEVARNVPVRIRAPKKRLNVPKRIRMNVPAEGWGVKKIKVKVKRRARAGRVGISATSNGWTGNTNLKIKSKKRTKRR